MMKIVTILLLFIPPFIMFKNPFSFNGRIRRTEYGLSLLIQWSLSFFLNLVLLNNTDYNPAGSMLYLILCIPMAWFFYAQGAKRCHDRGNSGWYQIIPFYIFWMVFAEGEYGPNEYGDDPKQRNSTANPLIEQE